YRAIATLVRDQQASIHLRHLGGVLDAALDDQLRSRVELHDLPIQRDGQVSHDTVESAMQSADLLIAPSRLEGGALVLAEAVAVGLPVVASRIPGHIGILGEDHPGWFPQGDAQALAARIGAWIASPRDRAALQAAGETVRYRLTDGAAEAASLVRLLRDILGHGPQPGPQPPVKNAPRHD
ncbi:MAG: glycosyltransferase, partial [Burkholderiaceae bacterium]|nr:glycosyltransferase [Burkholderiaceae bacterium]